MAEPTRAQLNELADKWLKGTLTPEEKELLDQWYDLDTSAPVNWNGTDESEELLSERLLTNIRRKKKAVIPLRRRWQLPAAAILLITLGVGSYFYFSKPAPVTQLAVVNDISPGRNKAVLTLGNGQKISLTDAINGEIAGQPGVNITKTADGKLIYEVSDKTLDDGSAPQYNTIEAPVGGQWQVKLPDGSLVFLNASSSITYPTRFTGNERQVRMKGEAYFEIAHNKKMPFKVYSNGQTIEVLGTHFNVMAYTDERLMKTTLLEGSVKVTDQGFTRLLKPGEQAQVSRGGINVTKDVDLEDVVSWKEGYFKFNEHLESIMAKIARWYDVKVEYQIKPDPELTFSGKISRSRSISGILKMLEYNGDVHFKIEGRRVIVTK